MGTEEIGNSGRRDGNQYVENFSLCSFLGYFLKKFFLPSVCITDPKKLNI